MPAALYLDYLPDTPVGSISIAASTTGLLAVEIGMPDPGRWAAAIAPDSIVKSGTPFPAGNQLREYLSGARIGFQLPLDWSLASPFQRMVLEAVAAIPYGETRSYGRIAEQLGKPAAARAVGRANATNPISIVLPCHRLVGADGSLRGYRAPEGIRTKAWLLDLERATSRRV